MNANESGSGWEFLARAALQAAGIYVKSQQDVEPLQRLPAQKVIRVDLLVPPSQLLKHPNGLAVSIKGQSVDGSADEKLWFHLDRVIPVHPYPVLLVMPGSAWHEDWIREAKRKVDGIQLIDVLTSIDELYEWALKMVKEGTTENFEFYKVMYTLPTLEE